MGRFRKLGLIIKIGFFFLFTHQSLISQVHAFIHYNVDNGLASSNVYSIMEDSKGYIWFSTDMGISRFDGYNFQLYSTAEGLAYNDVWGMYEDSKNRIWVYTFGPDFYYFENEKFHRVENNYAKDKSFTIINIKEDKNRNIWIKLVYGLYKFSNENELTRIDTKRISTANSENRFSISEGETDLIDTDENLFSIVNGELIHKRKLHSDIFPLKVWSASHLKLHFPDTSIYYFDQELYFDLEDTLIRKRIDVKDCSGIPAYIGDYWNAHFFSCNERLLVLNNAFEEIQDYSFVNKFDFQSLCIDSNRNAWIGTKNDGVYMLPHKGLRAKTYLIEKERYSVSTISKDREGKIWFGTKNGKIYYIKNDKINLYHNWIDDKSESFGAVKDLSFSDSGKLYVIYEKSVFRIIDLNNIDKPFLVNYFIDRNQILLKNRGYIEMASQKSFADSTTDTIIIATSFGLEKWTSKGNLFLSERLTKSRCYAVQKDENSGVWIGQPNGLFLHKDNYLDSLELLKERYHVLGKSIKTINIDNEQNKWIGTDGFGLFLLDRNNNLTLIEGLENTIIKSVFIDKQSEVWVATNNGLANINESLKVKFLTTAQGLASNEVNDVYTDSNYIYIGTHKGLTVIDKKIDLSQQNAPLFYIDKLLIRGVEQELSDNDSIYFYDLNYQQNSIKIDYTCLSYQSHKNITYEYKMSGIDTTWKETSQLSKEYPILPYGKSYVFNIRARDSNNQYSETTYQFEFKINPPWWETILFRLFVLSLVFLYLLYKINNFKEKEREKTAINKKFAELELQALQAQMNPHFVFNALQAIQDFVAGQDERSANKYMSNFSKLMRLFLESSKEKYISLDDEIQLLELYLELEQLRFEPTFDYIIDVPEVIDRSTLQIPAMLLQPFVENAVNHGLRYKKSKGFIKILISEDGNQLKIQIIDNGVGIKKAQEIKNKATQSYKSRGMTIIEERLKSLQYIDDVEIKIDVKDRYSNNTIDGTIVSLSIQIKDHL